MLWKSGLCICCWRFVRSFVRASTMLFAFNISERSLIFPEKIMLYCENAGTDNARVGDRGFSNKPGQTGFTGQISFLSLLNRGGRWFPAWLSPINSIESEAENLTICNNEKVIYTPACILSTRTISANPRWYFCSCKLSAVYEHRSRNSFTFSTSAIFFTSCLSAILIIELEPWERYRSSNYNVSL